MKKMVSLMLALLLVLALSVSGVAEQVYPGSVTINGVGTNATYEIYRLLDLESYDLGDGAYSYKVNSAWATFFATEDALKYFSIDDAGYVTWKAAEDDDTVAGFAKLALKYAKEKNIPTVKSSKNSGEFVVTENTGKFSDLPLGYYLVDSTMGALCGLTTTNPDASINAKNGIPGIDKQVQEDSTGNWGDNNSADIGQTIHFRTTVSVHAGAENFIMHDVMSKGLTFISVDKVEHVVPTNEGPKTTVVTTDKYTVSTDDPHCKDPACTFEVTFSQAFCDTLETNDKVIIYYSAMLNREAVVAGEGNPNTAQLEFGEHQFTTQDQTTTKTYGFDLVKTDSQNTLIDGAQFKIYDAAEGGNLVPVVKMDKEGATSEDENGRITYYRRARANEGEGVTIDVVDGKVRLDGFDNGIYYLEEVKQPDGYNILTTRVKFTIADGNLDAVFNGDIFSTGSGVHVVNKSGTMLPETGGIGTTLFYVFGGILAVAAVVLLVTKKRMSSME